MPAIIESELALQVAAELGEGPVWDSRGACLYFVDILRGRVHRFEPASGALMSYAVGQPVGAVALAGPDHLILAVRDGFARLALETGAVRMIADVERDRPDQRMNDGTCDAAGRFWAGTMALDERADAGALYRLDPDGRVRTMVTPVSISNGVDWSTDNRLMYFVDSLTQRVDRFDFDVASGAIANRRTFVRIASDDGVPDGLTVDAEDHVWVSLWRGGAVHRYAPDGSLAAVVRLPVTHPTSCCFGGDDLADLFITTASIALDAAEQVRQPYAGALFCCRPGVVGRPANRYSHV